MKHIFKIVLILISSFCIAGATYAQTAKTNNPPLKRFLTDRDSAVLIPLTNFCLIQNAGLSDRNFGWVMAFDLIEKKNSNLLFLEMNSTDVEGWMGNASVSGSVQLVVELSSFTDSITIRLQSISQLGMHLINNYGGPDAKEHKIKGKITLKHTLSGIKITTDIELKSRKPDTKQEIRMDLQTVSLHTLAEYQDLEKKKKNKQEKDKDEIIKGMVDYIMLRDSLMKQRNDSIMKVPYVGPFRFWISHVDKAGDERTTYAITDDSLIIKMGPYDFIYFSSDYPADKVVYKAPLRRGEKQELEQLGAQMKTKVLEETYFNRCIMDGLILHFHLEWTGKTMSSTVSNYYVSQVVPVIEFVNKSAPEKYKIWYNKEGLLKMQENCK
jgi:hypothetical protein